MMINEFEKYIRCVTRRIDDRKAAEEIADEMREHLTQSYEEHTAQGKPHREAVQLSLDEFGEAGPIGADLDKIHTPRFTWLQIVIIAAVVVLFILFVFGYFFTNLGKL